jgi:transcriptional regulator with XRE-family HTH domain
MPETIGQRLKQIRLSRQITIEKAAEATRVRTYYLEALEADNYSAMSSAAQGRGFLRLYADYLGLDLEAAMTEMRQEGSVDAPPEPAAPAAETQTTAPILAPQTPPAASDDKTVRRPFWSRLLRRGDSQPAATEEPVSQPAPVVVEEPAPEPVTVPAEEPAPKKRTRATTKTSTPKTAKPKTAAKKADKKKVSPKQSLSE